MAQSAPPAPADRPLLVYDGDCALCSATVRFILRHERAPEFRFAAAQTARGREVMRAAGLDPDRLSTNVVLAEGRALTRSDAVIRIGRSLQKPWRWISALAIFPRPLRDGAYHLVARNRLRLFGANAACFLAEPSQRERFLT